MNCKSEFIVNDQTTTSNVNGPFILNLFKFNFFIPTTVFN